MAKRSSRQESISTAYDRYHHITLTQLRNCRPIGISVQTEETLHPKVLTVKDLKDVNMR